MLSLVYAMHNRTQIFARTLDTLAEQDLPPVAWELVVVDDGGTDPALVSLLDRTHAVHGWNIQYHRIDLRQHPYPVFQTAVGANNPCVAWNVGIREAVGERIVLSSPEIAHRFPTNLTFCAEWDLDPVEALIGDVWDAEHADTPGLQGWISGGPMHRALAFLQVAYRERLLQVGGFEERFISGYAWDDVEFVTRWYRSGGQFVFSGPVLQAEHLWHPRPVHEVQDAYQKNHQLYESLQTGLPFCTANVGHAWGSSALIVATQRWTYE